MSLEQKRYKYRNYSVIQHIAQKIINTKPQDIEVFRDIPEFDINGSTLPLNIIVVNGAGSRPDLVLVNRRISLLEITRCFERNTNSSHRYTFIKTNLMEKGFAVDLVPFKIESRGLVT